jgi:hypothetical protein
MCPHTDIRLLLWSLNIPFGYSTLLIFILHARQFRLLFTWHFSRTCPIWSRNICQVFPLHRYHPNQLHKSLLPSPFKLLYNIMITPLVQWSEYSPIELRVQFPQGTNICVYKNTHIVELLLPLRMVVSYYLVWKTG